MRRLIYNLLGCILLFYTCNSTEVKIPEGFYVCTDADTEQEHEKRWKHLLVNATQRYREQVLLSHIIQVKNNTIILEKTINGSQEINIEPVKDSDSIFFVNAPDIFGIEQNVIVKLLPQKHLRFSILDKKFNYQLLSN